MKHLLICATILGFFGTVQADDSTLSKKTDTAVENVKEAAHDTAKATKKAYRGAEDKGCTMVKGKMECVAEKAKHKLQSGSDEVKDKVDDMQKK